MRELIPSVRKLVVAVYGRVGAEAPRWSDGQILEAITALPGKPGDELESYLRAAIKHGTEALETATREALPRALRKSGYVGTLFDPIEREYLIQTFAEVLASAELLGRYHMRRKLYRKAVLKEAKQTGTIENMPQSRPLARVPAFVFRTEKAHAAYKGKANYGHGLYVGLSQDQVAELTIDPNSEFVQEPDYASVHTYRLPKGLRVLEVDGDALGRPGSLTGEALKAAVLAAGYDAVRIKTDDLNAGGDQIVIYHTPPKKKVVAVGGAPSLSWQPPPRQPPGSPPGAPPAPDDPEPVRQPSRPFKPLPPKEALDYFRSLSPELGVDPDRFGEQMQRRAFTLAVATDKTLLKSVQDTIAERLQSGEVDFSGGVDDVLDRAGVSRKNPVYGEMVLRTNAMDAYNVGLDRERMAPDVIEEFPAWQYSNPVDSRSRPHHAARDGKYYPASVPFVVVRGTGIEDAAACRCTAIPIYKDDFVEAQRNGARLETEW